MNELDLVVTEVKLDEAGQSLKEAACQVGESVILHGECFQCHQVDERSISNMNNLIKAKAQTSQLWHVTKISSVNLLKLVVEEADGGSISGDVIRDSRKFTV